MIRADIFVSLLLLLSSDAFLYAPRPSFVATKLHYIGDKEIIGKEPQQPQQPQQPSQVWYKDSNIERAIDCTVEDAECDIDELFSLADSESCSRKTFLSHCSSFSHSTFCCC
jgi:hypothetical protein